MTTVVAMWCRHKGDDVIAVDGKIPWNEPLDAQHFRDVVQGQNVVCGRKTYEALPNRTIEGGRLFVFSNNATYEVADDVNHFVISSQKQLEDFIGEEDALYVAGGADVYELFLAGKEKFKPQIIVDCIYDGECAKGEDVVTITPCVAIMEKKYRQLTPYYPAGNVVSAIWVKKGEFVEQSVLKRIVQIIEN